MRKKNRQEGFMLIEIIAVLIIAGILAAFAGWGIVSVVQGYMLSKDTAAISEKAQLAIARINRELLECYTCSPPIGATFPSAISLPFNYQNTLGQRYIGINNGNIALSPDNINYDILIDQVGSSLTMHYNEDHSITVSFQSSNQPGGVTVPAFSTTVYPRNTY
jgi:prepilin-type N-terminal cleavage/methylation domain-containing protein